MLGGHDLTKRSSRSNAAMVMIKKWIIHDKVFDFGINKTKGNFDPKKSILIWDYSIIVLLSDVMLTKRIQPICLPPTQPISTHFYDGKTVYASGWGTTELIKNGIAPAM